MLIARGVVEECFCVLGIPAVAIHGSIGNFPGGVHGGVNKCNKSY